MTTVHFAETNNVPENRSRPSRTQYVSLTAFLRCLLYCFLVIDWLFCKILDSVDLCVVTCNGLASSTRRILNDQTPRVFWFLRLHMHNITSGYPKRVSRARNYIYVCKNETLHFIFAKSGNCIDSKAHKVRYRRVCGARTEGRSTLTPSHHLRVIVITADEGSFVKAEATSA